MKEFLLAAIPWIIIGVSIAIIVVNNKHPKKENYLSEGMSIGMCMGVALASLFDYNLGLGISLGMILGEAIGSSIKK